MIGKIGVGHFQDEEALTGCTVFLLPEGTVACCEVRGGAPGTRETELLRPGFTVRKADAILFTGGSAFGLAAAEGVVKFLEEKSVGYPTPAGIVPIVSAAVIFDLDLGRADVRPDARMGYEACLRARADNLEQGSLGAGIGATVGNVLGRANSTRGGFGISTYRSGGFMLDVAAVVNSLGDVLDENGEIIAGVRGEGGRFLCAETIIASAADAEISRENTTLVFIATNARLGREECLRVALQGHNGIARAVRPSHTRYDGDTVFVAATCDADANMDSVEVIAAIKTSEAIRNAVREARGAGNIPAYCDILQS